MILEVIMAGIEKIDNQEHSTLWSTTFNNYARLAYKSEDAVHPAYESEDVDQAFM